MNYLTSRLDYIVMQMSEIGPVLVHPWASLAVAVRERNLHSSVYWSGQGAAENQFKPVLL